MIRSSAVFLVLVATPVIAGASDPPIPGVTMATQVITTPRPDIQASRMDGPTVQRCHVFPAFVALEIDSGQVGVDEVAIRERKPADDVDKLCRPPLTTADRHLEEAAGDYVQGAVGTLLVTLSADSFGAEMTVQVFDVESGKRLFSSIHESGTLRFVAQEKKASLLLHARIYPKCFPNRRGCWASVMKELHVAPSVHIALPRCPGAHTNVSGLQFFAPARVDDLKQPLVRYLSGRATCSEDP